VNDLVVKADVLQITTLLSASVRPPDVVGVDFSFYPGYLLNKS